MSCNGCRVLRKGCSDSCILRSSLQWIDSADAQGHATVFVAKFFGRAGMISFINAVSESQRPALFQSLLYEACGRTVNPVYGAVGLLWSGNWSVCQAAVETVLKGGTLKPTSNPNLGSPTQQRHSLAAAMPMPPAFLPIPSSPPSTSNPNPNPRGSELDCCAAEIGKNSSGLPSAAAMATAMKKRMRSEAGTQDCDHSRQSAMSAAAAATKMDHDRNLAAAEQERSSGMAKRAGAILVPVPRRVVPQMQISRHIQSGAVAAASAMAIAMAREEEEEEAGKTSEAEKKQEEGAMAEEASNVEEKKGRRGAEWTEEVEEVSRWRRRWKREEWQEAVELSLSLNVNAAAAAEEAAAAAEEEEEEAPWLPSPNCSMSVNSEEGSVTTSVDTAEIARISCVRAHAKHKGHTQLLNLLQF